jgi:hypothetical protein
VPESFVSGSEKVNLNGLEQLRDTDYTTDPSNGEITWIGTPLPPTGAVLIIDYDHDDVMRTSNTLLHGSGAPSDANDGIDGDFYRDETAQLEYGPKAAGAWPAGYLYVAGASAFCYIAYASADDGTDFTLTFDAALNYVAILSTDTEIATPLVADFAGLWKNYKGATGAQGDAATIAVGTVTTLAAEADATVVNSGTSGAAVFDFGIPEGIQGEQGVPGTGVSITGPWDDEVTYGVGAQASLLGDSWVSLQAGNLNHSPVEGAWWTILAEKGEAGEGVSLSRWWFGS